MQRIVTESHYNDVMATSQATPNEAKSKIEQLTKQLDESRHLSSEIVKESTEKESKLKQQHQEELKSQRHTYLLEIQNKENLQSELNFIQKQSLEKEREYEEKIKYLEQKHKQELLDRDTQINELQSTLDLVKVQRQNDALDISSHGLGLEHTDSKHDVPVDIDLISKDSDQQNSVVLLSIVQPRKKRPNQDSNEIIGKEGKLVSYQTK